MKGFQPHLSRLLTILLIGLLVLLGLFVDRQLRERTQPRPLDIPVTEQSSSAAPDRSDGPLHEVGQRTRADFAIQARWVF
ncbi:hypothetical protein ACFW0H_17950 [Pseudomonas sp. CR3202]|uniref:hypothetical protein n=1 Tax=Pseudomonas sp. CR3202 TaxID=3351532 RepID=UPI003BF446DB